MSRSWKRRFCWITEGKLFQLWAELVAAVRRRGRGDGSDDDEDLGLPRSPPASPPTDKGDKRQLAGISQSSCSDGSLLSVGSSEMDEDSSSGHHHSHEHSARSDQFDFYNTTEPPSGVAPLSHSAAKHKMAVRPRRTHGAPRRKKNNPIAASALPITPELNEEMIRSTTPEVTHKTSEVVTESFSSSTTTKHHMIVKEQHQQVNKELQRVMETPSDAKLKSSSLPPGLALSQLVGQSPAKLTVVEANTPRSSIKRSQSSSQGTALRDSSPKIEIHTYHSEERMLQCRSDKKYAEESCLEKKSKSEKKTENENIRSSKKEESFFSRLLLRKSGKKSKKDQVDGDNQVEVKKSKTDKPSAQYKSVDSERVFEGQGYKPVPAERTHKSAGQKAFANQMHKRMDNKGAYVQDAAYKDIYSAAKVPGVEYNITDLKLADETDKILNLGMKSRISRREEFSEMSEWSKRTSSREMIDEKKESFNLHHDKSKRPTSVQRLVDPLSSKAFINNEVANRAQEEMMPPSLMISEEEPPIRAMRIKNTASDFMFNNSVPKNLPYFNSGMMSSSPPKPRHQSSENIKQRSSEHVSEFSERRVECKQESIRHASKTEESYVTSALRSLGDEYVETRSSIGKSHSFRYASETTSISSQENQMPSLPAIVGISEPLLESWEVNYRRNVSERQDLSKRISARNYILQSSAEANYDSLPSTDSSYMDSLKTDVNDDRKLFTNSIHITMDSKRDSDISQIEAKIDDIISSPKPIIPPILKSSSLDSIKSSPEKPVDDRRKTISVESTLSHSDKTQKEMKPESETFISVTHINKEQTPVKTVDTGKVNKVDEKAPKSGAKLGVPEFLNIQLNKVDAKPTTNIVLTANITPKKNDSPQIEKEQESFPIPEIKTQNVPVRKDSFVNKQIENVVDNTLVDDKASPVVTRKSVVPSFVPQSPSTPKAFFKRKAGSVELPDKSEKTRTNSLSTEGSTEKIYDNISIDQKSHSSFGSKSSIQSMDSNDNRNDKQEEGVVYRKKPVILSKELRNEKKNDDEPELMKVFARRSLKIKDSEADSIAQEIAKTKEEMNDSAKTKILKNEFNASIKSRDSDKENEDIVKEEEKRLVNIAARVSQFGAPHYQRSVSINSVSTKRDSAPVYRSEVHKYKKEVSDSTPEKRLRNRTFPDSSNDREDLKNIAKSEAMAYKADTLTKRPWQRNEEKFRLSMDKERCDSAVIEKDGNKEKEEGVKEKDGAEGEADASPQFKGILQMRAEWERRAKQGMTK
ncbi:uncharacterized protein LOC115455567 isoform X2 [Manduca sexta]|uniref:DUF4592 domain-containing protein n=1 Tax=Manduca sexta TaxID=7130 RepID=A0A922CEX1_MANSE|nr:uncharacterized protein LOC115455567 isoform X2 [Manduca sexta]XP_030040055.1 uncharacterized protein LOC115455567 isoform X2 [Manduca sexta]XP_030040057.1 uncharacterized protein LOC115455567 isoform X2 [Manduca sexta]KAG6442903.1 hypothetical protein O3G_MSEX002559 [Manduca sexta]KAG6442904.1 hypothetical protein O3G_MSEX002559 [Manduca sexta]KAG6442905.1 hypothetical protein O3G_MSEX002559 [Manduca sexta]KAG6442906.1 hypothetical protein O3G_MSEX002559 [Manduca sexta]KAG6442907.1 hypot